MDEYGNVRGARREENRGCLLKTNIKGNEEENEKEEEEMCQNMWAC